MFRRLNGASCSVLTANFSYGKRQISTLYEIEIPEQINPYPGNVEGIKYCQCGFCRKSHSKQWNETAAVFCGIVTDPLGLLKQLSISLYLLPVLRVRFGRNVHVTGFATTSIVRP